jgi:predicted aldo/keto reductase-like oxidoreductase
MKQIKIGNWEFSKVLCGTNPFYARSHFSNARDAEYRARFDDEKIERMIERCLEIGINAVESSANERIITILSRLRNKTQKNIHFVGTTRIDETSEMKTHHQKLEFLLEKRAQVCIIHAQYVDRPGKQGFIQGLAEFVDKIHSAGLLAGVSTHRVETIELCEKYNYGIDIYMFPLNPLGFVYRGYSGKETVQDRIDIVRGVGKPFILMKVLGAGRVTPKEGFQFIAENSKSNDLISVGFGTEEEITESVQLVEKYF